MLKGLNRRVVIMKDTGSDYFDQAFFLVKENALRSRRGPVDEAKKIIRELELKNGKKSMLRFIPHLICFLLGGGLGFILSNF